MYLKKSGRMGCVIARSILSEPKAKYRNAARRQVMKQKDRLRTLWDEPICEVLGAIESKYLFGLANVFGHIFAGDVN